VTSWAASSLNSGLKEGLCFSVIFPPINEGVILSRHLIRWPNSLCHYTVSDELADALTNVTLTSTTIQQAIHEYLEQHKGRDKSVPQRLGWWAEHLGDKTLNKVNRQRIKNAISILEAEGKAPATLNRYKAALSAVFAYMCDRYDLKEYLRMTPTCAEKHLIDTSSWPVKETFVVLFGNDRHIQTPCTWMAGQRKMQYICVTSSPRRIHVTSERRNSFHPNHRRD
ncbi:MAG: hypothetical protein ACRC91_09605, partial [Aeromonas sp.]